MFRNFLFFTLAVAVSPAFAFDVELQRQDGSPYGADDVELSVFRVRDANGVETVKCRAVSKTDGVRMVRIVARDRFSGATRIWDGRDERTPPEDRYEHPLYLNFTFLMGAMWKPGAGIALGTGAEDGNSDADVIFDRDEFSVSVHASFMGKGAEYACTFHRIAFDPKYGIRDALARYYPLYPARFRRNPAVSPWIHGISAEYASWKDADPESCRFMNATWEWCHGADRSWGDMLGAEQPTGRMNDDYTWVEKQQYRLKEGTYRTVFNSKMTGEEFARVQTDRLASGYFCGVANGFYTMALANISNRIALRYPDSVATGNSLAPNDYFYSTEVFTFPECSWGRELRRQIAELVAKCDLGAVAFDVSRPRSVYRGERLREMGNVSWDGFGPGVVRGVGSAKLFEYIRTLPNRRLPGKTAVAVNTKYQHLSDLLYIDMTMFESTPWDHDPPFPLAGRYALGEKGLTLWEGYSPREFDPNFNKWPERDKALLINDLSRYAVQRSLVTAASLPRNFLCEYASDMSHAFVRLNEAGWKPVLGFEVPGAHWELARYGLGDRSWLVACNGTNAVRKASMDVFPGEIATGFVGGTCEAFGFVYAPFFGGAAANILKESGQRVVHEVGPLMSDVLECVGTAKGRGGIAADWSRDGDAVVLTLISRDFGGTVELRDAFEGYRREGGGSRRLSAGDTVRIRYVDPVTEGWCAKVAALDLSDLRKVRVRHAADQDSKDMGDRIAAFFRGVTMPADAKKARNHVSPVTVTADPALRPGSVCLGDVVLTASDRVAFSTVVRRFLNVLNRERYPDYGPQHAMSEGARRHFTFMRY